jgi:hypothetical protein
MALSSKYEEARASLIGEGALMMGMKKVFEWRSRICKAVFFDVSMI